ncbi:MAG: sodium:solute symporter family protein, partial [Planctomycetota bacterium]
MVAVIVIVVYLTLLLGLGVLSNRFFRGTAADYFLASRGIGSFLLLMSLFGTTMTAFALIGSTGEAYKSGIAVYGKMVSWSGLLHSFCFFAVGIRLWSWGRRFNYTTQIQFFRDRFESDGLGLVLFPALVGLVIPYLLIGVIGGGTAIQTITRGALPGVFASTGGGVPFWLGALLICAVVLTYVFFGGVRGTAWANAFQTIVFIVLGLLTFALIAQKLGGPTRATANVIEYNPAHLRLLATEADERNYAEKLAAFEAGESPIRPSKPKTVPPLVFFSYMFI